MREFVVIDCDGNERRLWISSYSYSSGGWIEMLRGGGSAGVIAPGFRAAYYADAEQDKPAES